MTEHNDRYGHNHRRLRKQIKALVDAGRANCWRCGEPIEAGTDWDLGHADHTEPGARLPRYMGPEHQRCNRATAGRNKPIVFDGPPCDTSRLW
jgi:hypothetical protein